jgi:Concanavalin A-like lectin/glucanases superfamily
MRCRVLITAVLAAAGASACNGADAPHEPTSTAAPTTISDTRTLLGHWPMDDAEPGTIRDESGRGHDGTRGPEVGATGESFRFPGITAIPDPERLATIPDSPDFAVGSAEFVVSVRVRTTSSGEHNLVQHGQNTVPQFWKVEVNANGDRPGVAHCTFSGEFDSVGVSVDLRIDDGEWHTVTCSHTSTTTTIDVDGVWASKDKITGPIDNDQPISIGGKPECDGVDVECDYFVGDLADLRIEQIR